MIGSVLWFEFVYILAFQSEAYKIRPNCDSARVAMGVSNSHLLLDGVMALLNVGDSDDGASSKTSKRLLIWKDQPDEFEHDLESD